MATFVLQQDISDPIVKFFLTKEYDGIVVNCQVDNKTYKLFVIKKNGTFSRYTIPPELEKIFQLNSSSNISESSI